MRARHHGVTILHGSQRTNGVRTANILLRGLRDPPVENFPFLYQLCHHARDLLSRNLWIDAVLIEEIDVICPKPLQRGIHRCADHRRPCVGDDGAFALFQQAHIEMDPELRREDDLIPIWRKGCADQPLVVMRIIGRTVYLRRIKERDAHIYSSGDQLAHLLFVRGPTVALTHPHAAKPDG